MEIKKIDIKWVKVIDEGWENNLKGLMREDKLLKNKKLN
jgi:hypothetical protein